MLIFLLIFLLISNAVTVRRDKSILFSRIVIKSLILIGFIVYNNMYVYTISKNVISYICYIYRNVYTTITFFSFVGIPPIIGLFGKLMIPSLPLDNGYVFMCLIAILTSVIGAGYYLNLIKQIFFYKDNYQVNPAADNVELSAYISEANTNTGIKLLFNKKDMKINGSLSVTIYILTFLLVSFIFIPTEWFNIVSIIILVISIL